MFAQEVRQNMFYPVKANSLISSLYFYKSTCLKNVLIFLFNCIFIIDVPKHSVQQLIVDCNKMSSCYSTRMVVSQDVFRNTPHWCTVGTHTHFRILWQASTIHHTHSHRQDQGQLPASIFIIFMFPDLLLPFWRQWSKPSPAMPQPYTHTHLKTHMLLYTQQPDNWDQLLQGASSFSPAPLLHPAAAALALLAENYPQNHPHPPPFLCLPPSPSQVPLSALPYRCWWTDRCVLFLFSLIICFYWDLTKVNPFFFLEEIS